MAQALLWPRRIRATIDRTERRPLAEQDRARARRRACALLVSCAWCERLSGDGEVWFRPTAWRFLLHSRARETGLTHGICPGCFSLLAPDVPYPARA